MTREDSVDKAVTTLRNTMNKISSNEEIQEIINAKDEVISRYGKLFNPANIKDISVEEFYSFLLPNNNKHWGGLYRAGKQLINVMDDVRSTLLVVLDSKRPLSNRIEYALPKGRAKVSGLGKALLTAIMMVTYPDLYGVWNTTSEAGLKALNLWPDFKRGESTGSKYTKINQVLLELSSKTGFDLWTLDTIFWAMVSPSDNERSVDSDTSIEALPTHESDKQGIFSFEKHLQDFLHENWDQIGQLKEWEILQSEGDEVGIEYPAGNIGSIDILAKHRNNNEWLIIELKRDQTSDATLGQVQRYMGWVMKNLAEPGDMVNGLIIAGGFTEKIKCALLASRNIRLMKYHINFDLEYEEA